MSASTKKCPMCAEQIPLEATVCEYCGAQFEISEKDGCVESRFVEEALPETVVAEASQPTPSPGRKRNDLLLFFTIVLIVGVVGGLLWFAGGRLMTALTPTATPTQVPTHIPTRTPNYAATNQAYNAKATTEAENAWVFNFAQPILDDVQNRQPNFEDDFSEMSGRFVRWKDLPPGVSFSEGAMRINTTGAMGVDAGGSMNAKNFVLEFEFTPRVASEGSTVVVNFRWNDAGGYNFDFNLFDTWWGLLSIPKGQDVKVIAEGWSEETELNRSTFVTVIAKDNRFAFFANGRPLIYAEDDTFGGDWAGLGVWSPNSPAEVEFDNVKFWDLNNLLP